MKMIKIFTPWLGFFLFMLFSGFFTKPEMYDRYIGLLLGIFSAGFINFITIWTEVK